MFVACAGDDDGFTSAHNCSAAQSRQHQRPRDEEGKGHIHVSDIMLLCIIMFIISSIFNWCKMHSGV